MSSNANSVDTISLHPGLAQNSYSGLEQEELVKMRLDLLSAHNQQQDSLRALHKAHLAAIHLRIRIWDRLGQEFNEEAIAAITAEDVEPFEALKAEAYKATCRPRAEIKKSKKAKPLVADEPRSSKPGQAITGRNMFVAEYLKTHDVGQFPNAWKELSKAQQKEWEKRAREFKKNQLKL